MLINGLATAINAGWSYFLLTWGRRQRSPALVGDGWHLMTDVATSVGVIVGLLLAMATGWQILDPALAALVGANILWAGWRLVRESVSGLMDEAVTAEVARSIRHVISSNAEGAIEAHDVKTRTAGRVTFIEFHLVVPGTMTVAASHHICDRIEQALQEAVHDAAGADPRRARGGSQADRRAGGVRRALARSSSSIEAEADPGFTWSASADGIALQPRTPTQRKLPTPRLARR